VRLALLSDQHGNDVAFRAAVEDVEWLGVEEIVCLGDVVQGGTEPAQTLDRLAALGCETVLGTDPNHCGACGIVCAPGQSCQLGVCT